MSAPRDIATAFQCRECGLKTTGTLPRGYREPGDGSCYYPRRHYIKGNVCPGVYDEAVWVTVPYGIKVWGGRATA